MRIFLDASVLIAASRVVGDRRERVARLLDDENHAFVASPFVRLEVLPKPVRFGYVGQVRFLESYLTIAEEIPASSVLIALAEVEARALGLSGMDALHLSAARLGACDQLVTLEGRNKPMYRSSLVQVVHLDDL